MGLISLSRSPRMLNWGGMGAAAETREDDRGSALAAAEPEEGAGRDAEGEAVASRRASRFSTAETLEDGAREAAAAFSGAWGASAGDAPPPDNGVEGGAEEEAAASKRGARFTTAETPEDGVRGGAPLSGAWGASAEDALPPPDDGVEGGAAPEDAPKRFATGRSGASEKPPPPTAFRGAWGAPIFATDTGVPGGGSIARIVLANPCACMAPIS